MPILLDNWFVIRERLPFSNPCVIQWVFEIYLGTFRGYWFAMLLSHSTILYGMKPFEADSCCGALSEDSTALSAGIYCKARDDGSMHHRFGLNGFHWPYWMRPNISPELLCFCWETEIEWNITSKLIFPLIVSESNWFIAPIDWLRLTCGRAVFANKFIFVFYLRTWCATRSNIFHFRTGQLLGQCICT